MRVFGYRLVSWIKHPVLVWEAYQRQSAPVVNLDNPELNCLGCGHQHDLSNRSRVRCFCCRYSVERPSDCEYCDTSKNGEHEKGCLK